MSRKPVPSLLTDLLDHARRAIELRSHCANKEALLADRQARDAILWNIFVVGEISTRFDDGFRESHPEIAWHKIRGMRNILAHGYDMLDWDILETVLQTHLPELIRVAQPILNSFGPPPEID